MKLTPKQHKFADEYIIRKRIYAALQLAKRYVGMCENISLELVKECMRVVGSKETNPLQKLAAKALLKIKYGSKGANDLIEKFAIVTDRNDPLVRRWRHTVKERDKFCQICGSSKELEVHHISHWADDPVNRIEPRNGVLLCALCHSKQHPELSESMFGGKGSER